MALDHLDELQKAEKYPIRLSLSTSFTVYGRISVHSSWRIGTCMRQQTMPALVQIMAFISVGAKALSEPMLG